LINQLLDLSRFDSGKIKLQATSQNIVPFLKGILTSFHTLAVQNQLELDFQPGDEKDISIYFEAPKMEEVIVNLLINAVKFTPAGGRITLSVSKEGAESSGLVRISVRDTGIGIPKEQFSHIFDRFYQAGNLKKKGHKGTGIGLALVKEIITLHHGKIDVHSQEGKGTEFNIRLPLGAEHLEPEEIVELSEMVSDYKKGKEVEALFLITEEDIDRIGGQGDEDVGLEKDTVSEDKTEEHEKNVLLLVEDNGDVRKHIRDSLKSLYTVVEAGDGKEGIANAKEFIPDLIISDIMMPEADGYELCRVLKQDIKTSHIPIILLTSKASEDSIIQGLEIGADEYVTKPFNINILIARIKNLIDQRRQLQLKFQSQKMVLPSEIPLSSLDEAFLKEFQDIIEKNLSNPDLDEDQLCLEFHMSQAALFRKIQSLTGESPNQFIQSYRLERSAQLLKTNFGNVTEVAFEVGFSSTGHFAKCFKARFHQLPTSFQTSGLKLKPLPAAYKGGIS